jgi:hypothetical protein
MATWHLEQLRAALERRGWECTELPGDDSSISATWELKRAGDDRVLHVDFEGLDDLRVLPLAESYGCNVREGALSLYFRRQRSRELWEAELRAFVGGLET